ncbi:hypothetical protein [Hymenobacter psoromatis]|uniref:hypothetical protein n=1 Tax=Hymenobacter psoromatis TaxID=1484116 RepID=UPI001CBC512B|nr:hypothetical protein [Hymenobacter psoromatis]
MFFSLHLVLVVGLLPQVAAAQALLPAALPSDAFQAKALLALSDADMIPAAYVTGQLGPPAGADALTVAAFDGHRAQPVSVKTLPISNSVVGPPASLALTPDGRYAILAEVLGPRPTAQATLADLPNGRTLTVVDLADPQRPRVVQRLPGPARVSSVSISADGALVALAVNPRGDGTGTPLWLYHLAQGQLSGGVAVAIPGWTAGETLVNALFHPSRPLLALTNQTRARVLFAEVQAVGSTWQLVPWGEPVALEQGPFLTCFSPDGHYFFANATYTGGAAPALPYRMPRGAVLSVRLEAQRDAHGQPVHLVTSRAPTGILPEGLAVSPDGQLLVTVNLEQTTDPLGTPGRSRYASLSLFAFEATTGELTAAGDFAFDGLLPESAVFDNSSRRLAVANFGQLDDPAAAGSLDFWRVVGEAHGPERLQLVKTKYALPVQRGVNTLGIVR